jgi:hypothetical protein
VKGRDAAAGHANLTLAASGPDPPAESDPTRRSPVACRRVEPAESDPTRLGPVACRRVQPAESHTRRLGPVACRRVQPAKSHPTRLGPVACRRLQPAESGQATVELVAFLPLLLAVAFVAAALLAGHAATEQAGQAAQAGAMALLQGGDPRVAARRALPRGVRDRATIDVDGRRVTVSVRPPLPVDPVAAAMTASATADAGPEPSP